MSNQKKFLPVLYPKDRRIEKTWFILYIGPDGRRKKAYGNLNHIPTKAGREKEAQRIINELSAANALQKGDPRELLMRDLDAVINLRRAGWDEKTYCTVMGQVTRFATWWRANGRPVMDVMAAQGFLAWIAEGRSNTTRNIYRRHLKSLFLDLSRCYPDRYRSNPFAATRKLKETGKTKLWFRPFQVKQVTDAIRATGDLQLLLAVRIMHDCFARPNELRRLQAGDFLFESGKLRIGATIAKTGRTRHVPLPPELLQHLQHLHQLPPETYLFTRDGEPGAKPCSRDWLSKKHAAVLQALGYGKGYTFYSWKNTGAVKMMLQDRRPIRYISKCMGHCSLDMTDRYFESLGIDEMAGSITFPAF